MKITGKKDLAAEKLRGRAALDAIYVPRINEAMGPKFALYQAKAYAASNEDTVLAPELEAIDIRARFAILLDAIAIVESARQAAQARIDAATSAAEIDAVIAAL